jgi:hypothetical protein
MLAKNRRAMMTTQEMVEKINQWLRYHPKWDVQINLFDLYGCISVSVTKDGKRLYYDIGEQIDKRLQLAIDFLGSQGEGGL